MFSPYFIAKIFGPLFVIIGIWTLLYRENIKKIIESFQKTPGMLFLAGAINLLLGLTIINSYTVWKLNLSLLVTILGWFLFLRGLIIFFFPSLIYRLNKIHVESFVFCGLIFILWGLALTWFGFQ